MTTAFESYFETYFQKAMTFVGDEAVFSDGRTPISAASWDRKAAYLLWVELGRPGEPAGGPHPDQPTEEVVLTPSPEPTEEDWDIA